MTASGAGLLLVCLAGILQGSFLVPAKGIRKWSWENYWLIFSVTAYLICPWILAFATIPRLLEIYRGASPAALLSVAVFGVGWGVGAVTFGLGVDAIGLALGFATILGIAATAGTLIPLMIAPPAGFSFQQGCIVGIALLLMLAGVAVCSLAGKWKETSSADRRYRQGIIICIVSGLLSSCGNLGFAFGADITHRAEALGVAAAIAPNALWTLLTLPLFLCNAGFALLRLRSKGTLAAFRHGPVARNFWFSVSMGVMWMGGIALYGNGARRLGDLGSSLGWGILMSSMVLMANALGLLTHEWRGAPPAATRQLTGGVFLLVIAIAGLAYANRLH